MTATVLVSFDQAQGLEEDCKQGGLSCTRMTEVNEMGLVSYQIHA